MRTNSSREFERLPDGAGLSGHAHPRGFALDQRGHPRQDHALIVDEQNFDRRSQSARQDGVLHACGDGREDSTIPVARQGAHGRTRLQEA
ncbi:hypothetical protein ebA3723 [Aromatoleum aromaticum EbN1]|uniref:Uncharacterized protein n=1 Tax=Aromatoleum aromaticum (strain DSM 19018 / LMG 30748 / EbN1) TaxID=76114 RepID=Q5P390_AROAE|nr:hypothetical protein ebA3723 [Aromatoleum aromaticum EbN1]